MPKQETECLITIGEAAREAEVYVSAIVHLIAEGKLRCFYTSDGRQWVYESDVMAILT